MPTIKDWKLAMLRANSELHAESPPDGPSRGVEVPTGFRLTDGWGHPAKAFAERLHKAYGLPLSARLTRALKKEIESYLPRPRYRFNPKAPNHKKWLAKYAKRQGIDIPRGYNWKVPWVGPQARELVRRVQKHLDMPVNGFFSRRLLAEIRPARRKPKVVVTAVTRNTSVYTRKGTPPELSLHNAAARRCTWQQIRAWHWARGFVDAGYNWFVSKGGVIYQLRPTWAMGAHTLGHNDCEGICFEGNYDLESSMPEAQLAAGKWLVHERKKATVKKRARGHKEFSGNATSCPGNHFPLATLKRA